MRAVADNATVLTQECRGKWNELHGKKFHRLTSDFGLGMGSQSRATACFPDFGFWCLVFPYLDRFSLH
jgi:hypothetical protein